MQSLQEFFCEECGAANVEDATLCIACQAPLSHSPGSFSLGSLPALPAPVKPVVVTSPPTLQVRAGAAPITPGAALATIHDLKPGKLLYNRYRIEREIGEGGYSVVYRATDLAQRKRAVVIKQVSLQNLTARQIIEATETFNREATLLPTLAHENIPRFYGHFTDPEHWYLVMEYIPGQTLEEQLQKSSSGGYYSLEETLKIGIKLASLLEYLHFRKQPVIFRDIKPANIMLTPGKKVYLIDFGIARLFSPNKIKDTTPLGSPGFAAPEQYGRAQSDQRTDVYGLGATLQTLLTGRDPLELKAGEPSRQPGSLPSSMRKLLNEMMDADPSRRPRNMTVVKQRLQHILAQARRKFNYNLGLILGTLFFSWGALALYIQIHGASVFSLVLTCLWFPTALIGAFTLFIFLFMPGKRYFTFGVLTIVLALILLFQFFIPFL